MEVIVWIIATIVWAVAYAIAEIRLNNLKSKYYDALHENIDLRDSNRYLEKKNIDLEEKVNALDKECKMYLDEAVEIAEEKNNIAKYADFLIKRYEEVYEEKRKLECEKNAECRVQNVECKALYEQGQKIYWIDIIQNVVREFTVERVSVEYPTADAVGEDGRRSSFNKIEIGDMVFFTHEDAEKQLKSTREKKLNELRKYYIYEEEWDSLRELDRVLLEVAEKEK